jgi:hypothetical protein
LNQKYPTTAKRLNKGKAELKSNLIAAAADTGNEKSKINTSSFNLSWTKKRKTSARQTRAVFNPKRCDSD